MESVHFNKDDSACILGDKLNSTSSLVLFSYLNQSLNEAVELCIINIKDSILT